MVMPCSEVGWKGAGSQRQSVVGAPFGNDISYAFNGSGNAGVRINSDPACSGQKDTLGDLIASQSTRMTVQKWWILVQAKAAAKVKPQA
jgi:hypothetical protein